MTTSRWVLWVASGVTAVLGSYFLLTTVDSLTRRGLVADETGGAGYTTPWDVMGLQGGVALLVFALALAIAGILAHRPPAKAATA